MFLIKCIRGTRVCSKAPTSCWWCPWQASEEKNINEIQVQMKYINEVHAREVQTFVINCTCSVLVYTFCHSSLLHVKCKCTLTKNWKRFEKVKTDSVDLLYLNKEEIKVEDMVKEYSHKLDECKIKRGQLLEMLLSILRFYAVLSVLQKYYLSTW